MSTPIGSTSAAPAGWPLAAMPTRQVDPRPAPTYNWFSPADLAMVYGGQDVIDKYRDANLLPQGPGRSKILITSDVDWRRQVEVVVDSASRGGGTGCTNATSVLVEGDETVAAAFAEAVAGRLAAIPSLPPEDEKAVLPVHAIDDARRIEDFLRQAARGTTAVLGADGIVDDLGDGSAALRPAVHLVRTALRAPVERPGGDQARADAGTDLDEDDIRLGARRAGLQRASALPSGARAAV